MSVSRRHFSVTTGVAMLGGFNLASAQEGKIILGQSAAFTGPAAQLGLQFYQGAKVYFDQVNAQGGVGKRLIEIRNLDDGYEPDRCADNTRATSVRRPAWPPCHWLPRPKCLSSRRSAGPWVCASLSINTLFTFAPLTTMKLP